MKIKRQDTDGVKPLLGIGELGYDNYPAGGDSGRVYVGTGSENIPLAKKAEMLAVYSKADVHIARVDNPHGVTKEQVGLGNVENLAPADMPISSAVQAALDAKADVGAEIADKAYSKTQLDAGQLDNRYYTETEIDTLYSTAVKLTGNQTIEDVKTFTSSPTVPTPTADTQAANKKYVDDAIGAGGGSNLTDYYTKSETYNRTEINTLNSATVKLTGDQTIAGVKTFSSSIVGNVTGNSATATKLATARTINGVAFDGSANITVSDATAVKLTGNETIAGIKTFSSSPIVPTPTAATQAANKAYVDNIIPNTQALPIGAILNGYTIFPNFIVAFGGEFNRADYPKLWAYLQANPTLVKTQTQWQTEATANGGICGFFSSGNGTTTFRVPNLDKAFLRPDSRGVGTFEEGSYLVGDATSTSTTPYGLLNYDNTPSSFRGRMNWDNLAPVKIGGTNLAPAIVAGNKGNNYSTTPDPFGVARPKNIAVLPLIVAN